MQVTWFDSDGLVSDNEWSTFYTVFVDPFMECKPDESLHIQAKDFKKCLEKPEFKYL